MIFTPALYEYPPRLTINEMNNLRKAVKSKKIREFFLIKFSVFFFFINNAYICENFHLKPNKKTKL